MQTLITSVEDMTKLHPNQTIQQDRTAVDSMVTRIQALKRKLDETKYDEALYTKRTKQRIEHLLQLTNINSVDAEEYKNWSKLRLDRILVEYILRNGCNESAEKLANDAGIQELVDIELFAQARKIEDGLRRKSCAECLAWCGDNRSSLRKMKSTLEFNLRLQEYIELVRDQKLSDAIAHVRKFLIPWSDTMWSEIQQAMGLLAFSPKSPVYKHMFDDNRWLQLYHQFQSDHYSLNNFPSIPQLITTLQAGLIALKTPSCYQVEDQNVNCPVCQLDTLGEFAKNLPNSHHVNSCLVCWESGEIMDEVNSCMVLPNGYAYSFKVVNEIAANNNGIVKCPRTSEVYNLSDLRKSFIS
ncbi:GID complex subunit containing RING finger motif [Nowakowskiella sp. JEL0078]|nr:GID complex subunit containing RING finger motif [Nowakowskiella sp. JEL0078]